MVVWLLGVAECVDVHAGVPDRWRSLHDRTHLYGGGPHPDLWQCPWSGLCHGSRSVSLSHTVVEL